MKLRTRTDLYLAAALLAGLMAAQTIGTIQVYLSNMELFEIDGFLIPSLLILPYNVL